MIITISGTPGSGKSTVAKILAQKLKLKHYSTGDFMREMARNRSITLEELGNLAKTDSSIDQELDERQVKLGQTEDNFIIDARLGFHFIPHSLKIFIDADLRVRAERVLQDKVQGLRKEESGRSLKVILEKMKSRSSLEKERYLKYYKLNPDEQKHYDLIVDSTKIPATEVAEAILIFVQKKNKTYKPTV